MTFEEAWDKHRSRVRRIVIRMVRNPEDAEDLVQEVFLQLHRKLDSFRGESAFSTWLHRMTVNVVLMKIRKRKLQEESLDELEEQMEEDGGARFHKAIATCDASLETVAERAELDSAVASLPPGYRTVLVLHDLHGMEHHEIADLLGISLGASKSQLHKAHTALRERFDIPADDQVESVIAGLEAYL